MTVVRFEGTALIAEWFDKDDKRQWGKFLLAPLDLEMPR
jgi:hypothetical protein